VGHIAHHLFLLGLKAQRDFRVLQIVILAPRKRLIRVQAIPRHSTATRRRELRPQKKPAACSQCFRLIIPFAP